MPRTTPAYDDARRRQILAAAYRCFSDTGLHGTTMQAVADEAGLSVGALYRYFDGKEDLFAALAAVAGARRRRTLEKLEGGPDYVELASLVVGMMKELSSTEATRSVRLDIRLWAEALDDPALAHALRSALADIRKPVAAYMKKVQGQSSTEEADSGQVRDQREPASVEKKGGHAPPALNPDAAGRVVISLLVGLELQRAHEDDLDLRAYREVVGVILSSLEGR